MKLYLFIGSSLLLALQLEGQSTNEIRHAFQSKLEQLESKLLYESSYPKGTRSRKDFDALEGYLQGIDYLYKKIKKVDGRLIEQLILSIQKRAHFFIQNEGALLILYGGEAEEKAKELNLRFKPYQIKFVALEYYSLANIRGRVKRVGVGPTTLPQYPFIPVLPSFNFEDDAFAYNKFNKMTLLALELQYGRKQLSEVMKSLRSKNR